MLSSEMIGTLITALGAGIGSEGISPMPFNAEKLRYHKVIIMIRRDRFEQLAPQLSTQGFKILLDIVASAQGKLRTIEIPFTFGSRQHASAKRPFGTFWGRHQRGTWWNCSGRRVYEYE